ncbi:hypothetical protein PInf_011104 [Phytophthora infestans]|nr:hypothetical protein PInf_011044 [Phytophthora infestans]KAI9994472.1 hypothetical protein PInf_011104 [Phytophthora infestans]
MEPYFNSMLLHAITTLNIISFATFDIIISHSPLCVLVGSPRVAYAHLHVVFISDKPLLVLDEILSATNAIEHGWWPGLWHMVKKVSSKRKKLLYLALLQNGEIERPLIPDIVFSLAAFIDANCELE